MSDYLSTELRLVEIMDVEGNFHTVRMGDLKKGDVFRLSESAVELGDVWLAEEDATMQEHGVAAIVASIFFRKGS